MQISKKIAAIRKEKGLTQEQLADNANVTVRTIQRIENGESIPRAFTLKALAEVLGISFEDLANETSGNPSSTDPVLVSNHFDPGKERYLLKMLCLSCFGYLVIPFVHFLVPVYILKKSNSTNATTIMLGRTLIRQQVYWVVVLSLLMMLTAAYNFIVAVYFKQSYLLHYLWFFFGMYILNAVLLFVRLRRINSLAF